MGGASGGAGGRPRRSGLRRGRGPERHGRGRLAARFEGRGGRVDRRRTWVRRRRVGRGGPRRWRPGVQRLLEADVRLEGSSTTRRKASGRTAVTVAVRVALDRDEVEACQAGRDAGGHELGHGDRRGAGVVPGHLWRTRGPGQRPAVQVGRHGSSNPGHPVEQGWHAHGRRRSASRSSAGNALGIGGSQDPRSGAAAVCRTANRGTSARGCQHDGDPHIYVP